MPNTTPQSIAIYGGAFDPVHRGHLQCAENLQKRFCFDKFLFVPCKTTLLKDPARANTAERIEMLKLALNKMPAFDIDLREVNRDSPSYMIETLKSFHSDFPNASLILIIGMDAFKKLPQWHQWQELLEYCHILIMDRATIDSNQLSEDLTDLLSKHQVLSEEAFFEKKQGNILFVDAGSYPVSSTEIRKKLQNGQNLTDELPPKVLAYIRQNKLYL